MSVSAFRRVRFAFRITGKLNATCAIFTFFPCCDHIKHARMLRALCFIDQRKNTKRHCATPMMPAHDDALTPFLDTHADVFLTHIFPRVNAPARACACGIKDAVHLSTICIMQSNIHVMIRHLIPLCDHIRRARVLRALRFVDQREHTNFVVYWGRILTQPDA